MDNCPIVSRLNYVDLFQHCFGTAKQTGVAAAVEFPGLVGIRVKQEQQISLSCLSAEICPSTIVFFVHSKSPSNVAPNQSIRTQTVEESILVANSLDFQECGLDHNLAGKVFCADEARLRSAA